MEQLSTMEATKHEEISNYFNSLKNNLTSLSIQNGILKAFQNFETSFYNIQNELELDIHIVKKKLKLNFKKEYINNVNYNIPNSNKEKEIDNYLASNINGLIAQYLFTINNNFKYNCSYLKVHQKYNSLFNKYLNIYKLYDIFMVDSKGNIIYSNFKEKDFATNLIDGVYSNTGLADAYHKASRLNQGEVGFSDFKPYEPSYNVPASFLSTPIFINGIRKGALIFQIPVERINSIMIFNGKFKESGLGNTGECYLIGEDNKMRSNSRFHKNINNKLVQELGSTIGIWEVKTKSTEAALNGNEKVGKWIIKDYRGIDVLSVYHTINIYNQAKWVIVAEIDKSEAIKSATKLKKIVIISSFTIFFIILSIVLYIILNIYNVTSIEDINNNLNHTLTKIKEQNIFINKILDSQTNFTLITDGKTLKLANKTTVEFFGYKTLEEFHKRHNCICDFFINEDGYLQKVQDGKSWLDVILDDVHITHKIKIYDLKGDTHIFQINTSGKKIEEEEEEEEVIVIVFTDITELEKQNAYTNSIIQASDEIRIILDNDENIIDYSNEANIVFKKIRKNITLGNFLEEEEEEEEEEIKLLRKFLYDKNIDHSTHIAHLQNRYFKVIHKMLDNDNSMIIFYDVSDLKDKERLLQSQSRLSAVGEMMENITHQWKQPLGVIIGLGSVLKYKVDKDDSKLLDMIDNINTNAQYLSTTISDFRKYTIDLNDNSDDKYIFNISEPIKSTLNIFSYIANKNSIEIIEDIQDDFEVFAKVGELNQVITNILNNAKDALIENNIKNKTIKISSYSTQLENILIIEDNGGGIANDILAKIFEPYFTTKFKSDGTGIGLHMSYNIIKSIKGTLIATNTTKGARFTIRFTKEEIN